MTAPGENPTALDNRGGRHSAISDPPCRRRDQNQSDGRSAEGLARSVGRLNQSAPPGLGAEKGTDKETQVLSDTRARAPLAAW